MSEAANESCWFMACENEPAGEIVREHDDSTVEEQRVCGECAKRAVEIGSWDHFTPDDPNRREN